MNLLKRQLFEMKHPSCTESVVEEVETIELLEVVQSGLKQMKAAIVLMEF